MRITVVLPSYPSIPFGGFKVLYEYSNRLVSRGHEVTLIHPRSVYRSSAPSDRIKATLWSTKIRGIRRRAGPPWFHLDPRVHVLLTRSLDGHEPPDADILMASAWPTAQWVASRSASKGRKFYFVQDYEYWAAAAPDTRRAMADSFRLGLRHIAISDAVRSMLEDCGAEAAAVIRSGLDHDVFYVTTPVDTRDPTSVAFPLRPEPFKGTADAIAALAIARDMMTVPFRAVAFGSDSSQSCPDWIDVARRPTDSELREILNEAAIFALPSHYEGFGLTGLEAMACGAALLTVDSGGTREFAHHQSTAIVVPPRDPPAMARALVSLMTDPARRKEIASCGTHAAQDFVWERSVIALESLFQST